MEKSIQIVILRAMEVPVLRISYLVSNDIPQIFLSVYNNLNWIYFVIFIISASTKYKINGVMK